MSAKDTSSLTKEIKSRVLLSSLIQRVVELKNSGSGKIGLCPFHGEKTPSFHVRDKEERFKCFGCGATGDHFDFLMKLRGIEFSAALLELSEIAGIKDVIEKKVKTQKDIKKQNSYEIMKAVNNFFVHCLQKNPQAMAYLIKDRGLSEKMVKQAHLGYCPGESEYFLRYLASKNISIAEVKNLGLLKRNSDEMNFADRITFPISNFDGHVLAFGARAFNENDSLAPKYLNSVASDIYEKKTQFYGARECKTALQNGKPLVLVEGYFDAMAFWAIGIPALALCGTAFSNDHAQILKRFASTVTICFDVDDAGIKALASSLPILFNQGFQCELIVLDEKDPGTYLEKNRLEELREKSLHKKDAFCFILDLAAIKATQNINARLEQVDSLSPIFTSIKRDFLRRQYVNYFAKRIHEDQAVLWQDLQKKKFSKTRKKLEQTPKEVVQIQTITTKEKVIFQIVLANLELIDSIEEELFDSLSDPVKKIISLLKELKIEKDQNIEELILSRLAGTLFFDYAKQLLNEPIIAKYTKDEGTKIISSFNEKIKANKVKDSLQKNLLTLKHAEDNKNFEGVLSSLREHSELLARNKKSRVIKVKEQVVTPFSDKKDTKVMNDEKPKFINEISQEKSIFNDEEEWL